MELTTVQYTIEFTDSAVDDIRPFKKNEQNLILNAIGKQLEFEPLEATRNRKPLLPNELSTWELRVDRFRVFYDVNEESKVILIKAIGWKDHNTLYIRGREFLL